MKFKINEHPSILLFLISLVILGTTIFINILYQWKIYSIIGLGLAGVASLVLLISVIIDIRNYLKKPSKPTFEAKEKDDWNKD